MRNINLIIIAILVIMFVSCGSGNGGSASNLSFPSNAIVAKATIENGEKVRDIVATDQQRQYSLGRNAVSKANRQNIALLMYELSNNINKRTTLKGYSINRDLDEKQECSNGGYLERSVSTTKSTVTVSLNAVNCEKDGITMNGKIVSKMDISDGGQGKGPFKIVHTTYTSDFSISSKDINVKIFKNSFAKMEVLENKKIKLTTTSISQLGNIKSGQENAIYYLTLNYDNLEMYQTSGKVYINNLASYVDYDTSYDMSKTPFIFSDGITIISGQARYNMSNNGKVKIIAENSKSNVYVDSNGDGTYELSQAK